MAVQARHAQMKSLDGVIGALAPVLYFGGLLSDFVDVRGIAANQVARSFVRNMPRELHAVVEYPKYEHDIFVFNFVEDKVSSASAGSRHVQSAQTCADLVSCFAPPGVGGGRHFVDRIDECVDIDRRLARTKVFNRP